MRSRYEDAAAADAVSRFGQRFGHDLALRVYTSRLLGAEPSLVLHGGGNTSVKSTSHELTGEPVDVLYVKGSGWDLATIEPQGFPACRLAELRKTAQLRELSDEDMVRALRSQMLDPASPTPSVEALLHAWMPAKFVDHTHANAVLAVVDQPDGREHAHAVWGDELLFVPYVMPGFVLAKAIVELGSAFEKARVMVLDKHGIFTWGETAKESYERMIEAVSAAERYLEKARAPVVAAPKRISESERRRRQTEISPRLRGALAQHEDGRRFVIEWRDEPEILALLERDDARTQTQIGTATPDHVIRTKPVPAWLEDAAAVKPMLSEYARWYEAYFERSRAARNANVTRLDRLPRLVLAPGLGVACLGKTRKEARIAGDIWAHTSVVIANALALGAYRPVSELDLFDVEYWSLEQAKLKLAKGGGGALDGQIALVTGASSGIGRATAELFLARGAHVLVTDLPGQRLSAAEAELRKRFGLAVEIAECDVTDDASVKQAVKHAVHAFGGLDLVVSNAGNAPTGLLHTEAGDRALRQSLELNLLGHQRVARAATEVLLDQGLGGCLLFNASKSAFNQGPEFGPYAVPKSGVIALMKQYAVDLGPHGIRANAVNADRIRTDLFGGGVLEARAKARGISADEYFRQNLLHRETTAADVAEAFAYLAVAGATTGSTLSVDGGNPAAFAR